MQFLDFSLLQGAAFVIEAVCEELEVGAHLDLVVVVVVVVVVVHNMDLAQ